MNEIMKLTTIRTTSALFGAAFLVLSAAACANPADNVPSAEVKEAEEAPAAPQTTPASTPAEEVIYEIGEESTIGFTGSKVTGSHDGGFHAFDGRIVMVDGEPSRSKVELNIDTTSLWADNDRLTGHLKSPDFFDVEQFPEATFSSTEIVPEGEGYSVTGNLDLHGITKSITFPATISTEEGKVMAKAEFSIMRFDFDIEYPGKPDDLIRDEVVVKLDIVATPAGA